jgi:hypothetical protein
VKVRVVNASSVLGTFACFAVRQSPYPDGPEDLVAGIRALRSAFERHPGYTVQCGMGYVNFRSERDIEAWLVGAFDGAPVVAAWGSPKSAARGGAAPDFIVGGGAAHDDRGRIVDLLGPPAPDDDCIDEYALASNVAHRVWADAERYESEESEATEN